jgi:hypothetical protein
MHDDAAAERFRVAVDLFEAGVQLQRCNLKRLHPEAAEAEIDQMLQTWLLERPGAEFGDAQGRPGPWPRK